MTNNDTIVAIASPHGMGGISIIRLSGPSAANVADDFFCAKSGVKIKDSKHAKMNFGTFDLDGVIEKGYAVFFKNPKSFTGEDVVEFQVHGGTIIAEKIIEKCKKLGARIADKGEFSKRAFLNGKASLDSLEGMIDMIESESEAELRAASMLHNGKLYKELEKIESNIVDVLSEIEVAIDYPDEIDEITTIEKVVKISKQEKEKIDQLLKTKASGKMLKNGVRTAIVGKPNVGKSSILNSILGEDRAIVTDIEGTTRDTLHETFVINGVKFSLVDTAGIRETSDIIESIGVKKAKQNITEADLVLFVIDGTRKLDYNDKEIEELSKNTKSILVLNKIDEKLNNDVKQFFDTWQGDKIEISAKSGLNVDKLIQKMLNHAKYNSVDGFVVTNERHIAALEAASDNLAKINNKQNLDLAAFCLNSTLIEIGKITGKTASEEIVNRVFSRFCVGK